MGIKVALWLCLMVALDLILTAWGLAHGRVQEVEPVARWCLIHHAWTGYIVFRCASTAAAVAVSVAIPTTAWPRWLQRTVIAAIGVVWTFPVVWNLIILGIAATR